MAYRLFLAIFLIVAGILLFLDNIGLLPIKNLWNYWPVLLIAFGAVKLASCRTVGKRFLGLIMIAWGAGLLLLNLGILHIHTRDNMWTISLLLITFGLLALVRTLETGSKPAIGFRVPMQPTSGGENYLNEHAVLGSINRRVNTSNFQGGSIESIFANVEVDLRQAQVATAGASPVIAVNCVFGAVKLRLPDTWKTSMQTVGVLGMVEDRTIPPRVTNGLEAPVVVISGQSVFGSVEVEN